MFQRFFDESSLLGGLVLIGVGTLLLQAGRVELPLFVGSRTRQLNRALDWMLRIIGILAIILGGITLLTSAFHG